ncbi:hypothetical protein [Chryseobacterium viscerum]|uniref:Uncharacterized protein n=1 Tax=Chryseobacterium viscerum TaxID=1037377 RepID=A0A316WUY0_9FLAO|nr:hypothetical protein [Chryseobacterium viscerum]PWN64103.1 hypothetical protein C1634_005780 [Chryseobacterium viscerum]
MASKQLNFFITPDDHDRINEMILERNIMVILKQNISDTSEIVTSKTLPSIEEGIFQVYLLISQFLDKIVVLSTDNGKKYFDINRSYLLEFSLGGYYAYDRNILQSGRLYFVKSFYNNLDELEEKSHSFCEWCDSVIRDFKKEFLQRYSNDKDFFYSKSAIEWIEKNNAEETDGGLGWKKKI